MASYSCAARPCGLETLRYDPSDCNLISSHRGDFQLDMLYYYVRILASDPGSSYDLGLFDHQFTAIIRIMYSLVSEVYKHLEAGEDSHLHVVPAGNL